MFAKNSFIPIQHIPYPQDLCGSCQAPKWTFGGRSPVAGGRHGGSVRIFEDQNTGFQYVSIIQNRASHNIHKVGTNWEPIPETMCFLASKTLIKYVFVIIEGSLEVKLPTIWTDEKQSRAEAERREKIRRENSTRERARRKKMQMREKVGKSQNTVFSNDLCLRRVEK